MSSLSVSSSNSDSNSLSSGQEKKRRRGGSQYNDLLQWLHALENDRGGNNGYKTLGNTCFYAHCFLDRIAKLQRNPSNYLDAGIIVISFREHFINENQWGDEIRLLHGTEWVAAMNSLFESIIGRKPDRSTRSKLKAEGEFLWSTIKLPYTEEQFQYLQEAWGYYRKNSRNFTYAEEQKFYHTPLNFDDLSFPPKAITNSTTEAAAKPTAPKSVEAPAQPDDATLIMAALALLSCMTRTLEARQKAIEPALETVDPEQVDADDQERIDRIAGGLLDGIDWESEDE